MSESSKAGWAEIILGILLAVLGIVSFVYPDHTLTGIVVIYGIVAVITGIADMVFYVKVDRYTGFGPTISLITGVLSVMAGLMLICHPGAGKWILSLLVPLWFIAHCVSGLARLNFIRYSAGNAVYYMTMILNIIGLVLGFVMLFSPYAALLSASYIVGFYLVLLGCDSIVTGISRLRDRW